MTRLLLPLSAFFAAVSVPLSAQVISSIAGTESTFPATEVNGGEARFGVLAGIVKDTRGNTYFTDHTHSMVFRLSANQTVSIIAGTGIAGFSGEGGPGPLASMNLPFGVAVDAAGTVFVADTGNNRIRRINTDGTIVTIAGTGAAGAGVDNIPAVMSPINSPVGVVVAPNGTVYFSDTNNHRIRSIDTAGIVRTVAGSASAQALGDGGPALQALLRFPYGLHLDSTGNLFVADANTNRIRRITAAGQISTVAGNGTFGYTGDNVPATATALRFPFQAVTDPSGNLFIADFFNRRVRVVPSGANIATAAGTGQAGFSGDGGPAASAAISFPGGIFAEATMDFVFTDSYNGRIRRVRNGVIQTVAGIGIPALPATARAQFVPLSQPNGLAFDGAGQLYISDTKNSRILRVAPDGTVQVAAGSGTAGYTGDGGPPERAQVFFPENIALDADGNLYISDFENDRIRKVAPYGNITTVVGKGVPGFSGDGVGTDVHVNHPRGLTTDSAGNLYFADFGNGRVRRLGADGRTSTIAGTGAPCTPAPSACFSDGIQATNAVLESPSAVVTDGRGTVWVAETSRHRVRKFTIGGTISTVAGTGTAGYSGDGGPGTAARLNSPRDIALDRNGNLYIVDELNHAIRLLAADGTIRTIAGTGGRAGFSGDGGSPLSATLNGPTGIALAANGDVYVSDTLNGRVRVISAAAPLVSAATPARLTFEAASDAGKTVPQQVSLRAATSGLPYSAATPPSSSWIKLSTERGVLPVQLEIAADASGLSPGLYNSNVLIATPNGAPVAQVIPVTFTVSEPVQPTLSVDRNLINVSLQRGEEPSFTAVGMRVTGSGSMKVEASVENPGSAPWLRVNLSGDSMSAARPGHLQVWTNAASLAPNTYTALINVTGAANQQASEVSKIRVNLIVTEPKQKFLLPQTVLSFQVSEGGALPAPQSLPLLNTGAGPLRWTGEAKTLAGGNWLRLGATSGTVARPFLDFERIPVSVDSRTLAAGKYFGTVQIGASGAGSAPQIATVQLTVLPRGSALAPEIQPSSLVFAAAKGQTPSAQVVSVFNPAGRAGEFTSLATTDRGKWLQYVPANAVMPPGLATPVLVQSDFTGLEAGVYSGAIQFRFGDGSVRSVTVTSIVSGESAPGALSNGKTDFNRETNHCFGPLLLTLVNRSPSFTTNLNEAVPLTVRVDDSCGRPIVAGKNGYFGISALVGRFSNGDGGTTMDSIPGGSYSKSITFQRQPASGSVVTGEITAIALLANNQYVGGTLPLRVQLGGAPPTTPRVATSVNAASFTENTPLAPGAFVTLFGERLTTGPARGAQAGPYPSVLDETRVFLGEKLLPLQYVSGEQINAQVPFDVEPDSELSLRVQRGDETSAPVSFAVASAQPAIFTMEQNGRGQAAAVNQSGTINGAGSPAARGSFVSLYCTGLGAVDSPMTAGQVAPVDVLVRTVAPVTATVGGISAEVQFAGLAPGFRGLYQVNLRIPEGIAPSEEAEVILRVRGQNSPPVTLAIQ